MRWWTQVCRQGLRGGFGRAGRILKGDEACSGGWTFPTSDPQPCPSCGHPLTVL